MISGDGIFDLLFVLWQGEEQKYWNNIMHSLLGGVPDAHYLYPYSCVRALHYISCNTTQHNINRRIFLDTLSEWMTFIRSVHARWFLILETPSLTKWPQLKVQSPGLFHMMSGMNQWLEVRSHFKSATLPFLPFTFINAQMLDQLQQPLLCGWDVQRGLAELQVRVHLYSSLTKKMNWCAE